MLSDYPIFSLFHHLSCQTRFRIWKLQPNQLLSMTSSPFVPNLSISQGNILAYNLDKFEHLDIFNRIIWTTKLSTLELLTLLKTILFQDVCLSAENQCDIHVWGHVSFRTRNVRGFKWKLKWCRQRSIVLTQHYLPAPSGPCCQGFAVWPH